MCFLEINCCKKFKKNRLPACPWLLLGPGFLRYQADLLLQENLDKNFMSWSHSIKFSISPPGGPLGPADPWLPFSPELPSFPGGPWAPASPCKPGLPDSPANIDWDALLFLTFKTIYLGVLADQGCPLVLKLLGHLSCQVIQGNQEIQVFQVHPKIRPNFKLKSLWCI